MVNVGGGALSLDKVSEILFNNKGIELDKGAVQKVETSFQFLQQFSSNKLIYGINTGFGPMAQYKVSQENLLQLNPFIIKQDLRNFI